jgi:hypothetical protein
MSALAAQLVDHVIPHVPVRQWVLSLPWALRYQLAFDAVLCRDVLAVFMRVVFGWLAATAARQGLRQPRCGAVMAIQRFGSALNLNLHLHSLVLDGVYTRPSPDATPVFHPLPPPTDQEIGTVLERVHARVLSAFHNLARRVSSETYDKLPLRFVGLHHPMRLPNVLEAEHSGWLGLVATRRHLFGDGLERNVRERKLRRAEHEADRRRSSTMT